MSCLKRRCLIFLKITDQILSWQQASFKLYAWQKNCNIKAKRFSINATYEILEWLKYFLNLFINLLLFFILCFSKVCFYIPQLMWWAVQRVISKILILSSRRTYCLYNHRCRLYLRSVEQFLKYLFLELQLEYNYSCPQ